MTALLRLALRDAVFAHWPVAEAAVAAWLPPGVHSDHYDGTAYVGLVGVRMCGVRPPWLPPAPHLSTFPQVNVRVYGVDAVGRRGVVFCSMDSPRLVGLAGHVAGLPYVWSSVRTRREGAVVGYEVVRRGAPRGRGSLVVETGGPLPARSALAEFLTERYALFSAAGGRTWCLPLAHRQWHLQAADEVAVDPGLVRAAGFDVEGPPASLLFSPGVDARFGRPGSVAPGRVR